MKGLVGRDLRPSSFIKVYLTFLEKIGINITLQAPTSYTNDHF